MRERCSDRRHIAFAEYLGCSAEFVEETYLNEGLSSIPDRSENDVLKTSIAMYKTAYKSLVRAQTALKQLPETQQVAHKIAGEDFGSQLKQMIESVSNWEAAMVRVKARSTGNGRQDLHAEQFGEFVARLFEVLGKGITFGIQPDTDEPSTAFGRAVQRGIEIYDIRQLPKSESGASTRVTKNQKYVHLVERQLVGWRRVAQKAFYKRR